MSGSIAVEANPVARARKFQPPTAPAVVLALVFALLFYQPFGLLLDD